MLNPLDFVTCDNAEPPHVKICDVATGETLSTIPILHGDVARAEGIADAVMQALTEQLKNKS